LATPKKDEPLQIEIGSKEFVRWEPVGITFVRWYINKNGERQEEYRFVVRGEIKITGRFDLDGETYFRATIDGKEFVLTVDDLQKELAAQSRVVGKAHLSDAISAVADRMAPKAQSAHATFGVYSNSERLTICDDPIPVKTEQVKAQEEIEPLIARGATREEVQAYADMLGYWHGYEVLPAMGTAQVAPFTPILREKGILLANLLHHSAESDLGKSLVALMFSEREFGISSTSGGAVNSPYRASSAIDATCAMVTVEEAERLKPDLWPFLKESSERWLADKRGTADLDMVPYHSRAIFAFTSQAQPITSKPVLKRFFIVRFDSSAKDARRAKSREVERKFNALAPIGYAVTRWAVETYRARGSLLAEVERVKKVLDQEVPSWHSPKRAESWACVYIGLEFFDITCRKVGATWKLPTVQEFVRDVVIPVESMTWEGERTPVSRFVSWFAAYRAKFGAVAEVIENAEEQLKATFPNIRTREEVVRDNRLYIQGKVPVPEKDAAPILGMWITQPLVDMYHREVKDAEPFASLADLAKQAAVEAGIDPKIVLDADGVHLKAVKFGTHAKRCAFIADVLEVGP
jgi:hypothetical protein